MRTVQEIKGFLKELNYVVTIAERDNGCEVTFPDRASSPKLDSKTAIFSYNEGVMRCNESSGNVPEYAFRLLACALILKWCILIGYNSKYLILLDKDGNELPDASDILEILKEPEDKVQKEKDANLIAIFVEAWPAGFSDDYDAIAAEYKVEEGYSLVKRVFVEKKDE